VQSVAIATRSRLVRTVQQAMQKIATLIELTAAELVEAGFDKLSRRKFY